MKDLNQDSYTQQLERIYKVSYALATTKDISTLLEFILLEAIDICNCDGGTIYRYDESKNTLNFEILLNNSLKTHLGGTSENSINLPPLKLYQDDGSPNSANVASFCALNKKLVNIPDAYNAKGFDFSGTRKFDEINKYRSQSFLTVPLVDHEGELVGVMQLINKKDKNNQTCKFNDLDEVVVNALSSQSAVAIVRMQLIEAQRLLFLSFIKLINNAIDEKSPYTGGHCKRVPDITMRIAAAIAECNKECFKNFSWNNKDVEELEIAALLHDCGKITTPVHVVDKGTKLESINNRIDIVNTRFLLLLEQKYTQALEKKLNIRKIDDHNTETKIDQEYLHELEQIKEDIKFINKSNTGGERMADEDVARVKSIRSNYQVTDLTGIKQQILTDNEVENLCIKYGTLTENERGIINYHITSTINMLESLPWPKHLKNVPEYAGGHHERMDGKGYPRGIKAGEMSIPARIMAVADVFEALTANDRPYKKAMPLSKAIDIMTNMAKTGHLDPDIFEVFLDKKIYMQYAQDNLSQSQIDIPN